MPGYQAYTKHWLFLAATWPQLLWSVHVHIYARLGGQLVGRQRWYSTVDSIGNALIVLILLLASCSILVGTGTYLLADTYNWKPHWQQVSVLCAVGMIYLINRLLTEHRFGGLRFAPVVHSLPDNAVESPIKYQHSALDRSSASLLFAKLDAHVSSTRAYEDADLTLPQLAQALSVSANHLSQVINQAGDQTFYSWISRHRVEAACRLLSDERQQHLSVLGVGYEVGFRSKSTYYAAFRRERGMTPNNYRKRARTAPAE